MGMSAGQARLLSITKRISNNEFRSQMITNSKLRLAQQSAEASDEYMNALNSQQLMFGTFDDDGNKSYSALTPNLLTTYSDLKNQYAMVTPSGKILVSGTDLKNYESSNGDLNVFLEKSGVSSVEPEVELPSNDILAYTTNLLSSKFPCWGGTGIDGIPSDADHWSGYQVACCEHVLASILWEADWNYEEDGNQIMQFKIENGTSITITNTGNNHALLYVAKGSSENDGIRTIGTTSSPVNNNLIYDEDHINSTGATSGPYTTFYDSFEPVMIAGTTTQETIKVYLGDKELTAYKWKGKDDKIYYTTYDMLNNNKNVENSKTPQTIKCESPGVYRDYKSESGTSGPRVIVYTLSEETNNCIGLIPGSHEAKDIDIVKQILKNNPELEYQLQIAYYKILCNLANNLEHQTNPANNGGAETDGSNIPPYGGITGGNISNKEGYHDLTMEEARDTFYKAMNALTVEVVLDMYMNDQEELMNLLTITKDDNTVDYSNYKAIVDIMEDYIAQKNAYIPDETDAKYQWYVNLWYRMGGGDESQKNYEEIDPNLFNSSEWLEFALEHGMITLEQAQFNADGSVKYPEIGTYDWNSIIYTSAVDIVSQEDEVAIARAEVKYKNKLTEIDNKDKKYEQDLKKLDTEHTALQTEYDSIKEVLSKNVERSFKAFS